MKLNTFITITLSLLLLALASTVLVFWFVSTSYEVVEVDEVVGEIELVSDVAEEVESADTDITVEEIEQNPQPEVMPAEEKKIPQSIYLRDLNLDTTLISALQKDGLDIDNYLLSPALLRCFASKLGEERFDEILAGDKVGLFDMGKIMPCVNA